MNTIFFPFSLLTFRFSAPFFIWTFSLYSPSIHHPSLPLVDLISDLLNACLVKNLLEVLWTAVNWDITVHVSFLHKCGQLVRCRAFNVVVVTFLPDISSFIIGFLPWNLSSKEWLPFTALILKVVGFQPSTMLSQGAECGQLVRCRAFNVVVATFLQDISSFIVGFLLWSLYSKEWLHLV